MKKLLSLALALVLVMGLSVTAFASSPIENLESPANASQNVEAAYTAATDKSSGTVYYVTVDWVPTGTGLAYTGEQAVYTWNGSSMQYEKNTEHAEYKAAGWSGRKGYTVTVTNQSNGSINVTTSADNNFNLTLTKPETETETLATAAVDSNGNTIDFKETSKTGNKQTANFTYTYEAKVDADAPTGDTNATITVGTISVTISKSA